MRRQHLLEQSNRPRYRALLDEATLCRRVGGAPLMAAQLDKILDDVRHDKVTVQVIPFDVGAYTAADSNFVLLEFENEPHQPPVVFIEGLTGNQFLERKADIVRYREVVEYLRDSALSPRDSIEHMDEVRKNYASEQDS